MAPSGMYWRCSLAPRSNILKSHGALLADYDNAAHYSSGDLDRYFGWSETVGTDAEKFADIFERRFAAIVRAANGPDPEYVLWY